MLSIAPSGWIIVVIFALLVYVALFTGRKDHARPRRTRSRNRPGAFYSTDYADPPQRAHGSGLPLLVLLLLVGIALWYFLFGLRVPQQLPALLPQGSQSSTGGTDMVIGAPTVTADFIDHVLAVAHSPAQGIGSAMVRVGVQYHIDPAYALAFFHHESSYGLYGMAATTHSIGNIRCTPGWTCSGGYRWYATWAESVTDWYKLLDDAYVKQGLRTVPAIIHKYAPTLDGNNETTYTQAVLADVTRYRQGRA